MEASRVAGGRVKATGLALFGGSRQLSDPVSAVSREETFRVVLLQEREGELPKSITSIYQNVLCRIALIVSFYVESKILRTASSLHSHGPTAISLLVFRAPLSQSTASWRLTQLITST